MCECVCVCVCECVDTFMGMTCALCLLCLYVSKHRIPYRMPYMITFTISHLIYNFRTKQ